LTTSRDPTDAFYNDYVTSAEASNIVRMYFPHKMTERLSLQQGAFVYGENVSTTIEKELASLYAPERAKDENVVLFEKLLIPSSLKRECLMKLRVMNISAQTLFPGVDGLGKKVKEDILIGV
jgi:hypothetical protein